MHALRIGLIAVVAGSPAALAGDPTDNLSSFAFADYALPARCTGNAAADFDGDGDLDVMVIEYVSSSERRVSALWNDGTGIFTIGPLATIVGLNPAEPSAEFDIADVVAFLGQFGAGCP